MIAFWEREVNPKGNKTDTACNSTINSEEVMFELLS